MNLFIKQTILEPNIRSEMKMTDEKELFKWIKMIIILILCMQTDIYEFGDEDADRQFAKIQMS